MTISRGIRFRTTRQTGFSLFEVVISLVITSIGLLGLAAMQAVGLKNNNSAYQRSQATVLAYDIADRMRANTISMTNYVVTLTSDSTTEAQAGCKHTGGCTTSRMALNDLHEWYSALQAALPGATGSITHDVDSNTYTIRITRDENQDGGITDEEIDVQVSFQPSQP